MHNVLGEGVEKHTWHWGVEAVRLGEGEVEQMTLEG